MSGDLFGNAIKLNIARGFWEVIKNACDIGRGLVVTMPGLKALKDPEAETRLNVELRKG